MLVRILLPILPQAPGACMKDSQSAHLQMKHRKSILPTMAYLVYSTPRKDLFFPEEN